MNIFYLYLIAGLTMLMTTSVLCGSAGHFTARASMKVFMYSGLFSIVSITLTAGAINLTAI